MACSANHLFRPRYIAAAIFAAFAIGCAVFFLTQDLDTLRDTMKSILETARGSSWSLPLVCGLYLLSSLVMFPVIALNLATAIVFGKIYGLVYALCGTLLSASVFFYIGRFGRDKGLKKLLSGPKLSRIDHKLHDTGVVGVATLRLVPIAPFGIFNMAAGITSLRFVDYITGTFIAFWPGGIARVIVGGSIADLFLNPTRETFVFLVAGIALWAAIVLGLHLGLKKFKPANVMP